MINNAKTSIVVTSHNYGEYLERCISSLLDQTVKPLEILIINDSSSDDTDEIAKKYSSNDIVHYYKVDFRSAQKSRNFGLSKSRGIYILNMDADNYLDHSFLEKAEKILDENEDISLVYTDHEVFGDERLIAETMQGKGWKSQNFDYYELRRTNYIDTTSLVRKDGFAGFDEKVRRFQDWDAWLTFLKGKRAQRIAQPLLFKRLHETSKTSTVQLYMERLRVLVKHDLLDACNDMPRGRDFVHIKGRVACVVKAHADNMLFLEKLIRSSKMKKMLCYLIETEDRSALDNMKQYLRDNNVIYRIVRQQTSVDRVLKGLRMNQYLPAYSMDYLLFVNVGELVYVPRRGCGVFYKAKSKLIDCKTLDDVDYLVFNKKGIKKFLNP